MSWVYVQPNLLTESKTRQKNFMQVKDFTEKLVKNNYWIIKNNFHCYFWRFYNNNAIFTDECSNAGVNNWKDFGIETEDQWKHSLIERKCGKNDEYLAVLEHSQVSENIYELLGTPNFNANNFI